MPGLVAYLPLVVLIAGCAPARPLGVQGDRETPIALKAGQEGVSDMTETVTAEVVLRSPDGSSILDTKGAITAENIAKYRVDRKVIEAASKKLEGLGFKVLQAGPTGLAISGDRARFEGVFQTTLEARSRQVMETRTGGGGTTYYEAKPITIPEELSSVVAGVVLPTPPELFP